MSKTLTKRMRPLLGTFVEVAADNDQSLKVTSTAFSKVEQVHQLLSFHNPESDLGKLNSAQGKWIELHPISYRCLQLAKQLCCASEGHFNPTLGWHIVQAGALPSPIPHNNHTLPMAMGSAHDIELREGKARLNTAILITLDGIAKGLAIDLAVLAMQRAGCQSGWINAGGDIRVFGDITLPITLRHADGTLIPLGGLRNAAIATSTRNSSSEYPGLLLSREATQACLTTSTVIAAHAWRADALTKVAASLSTPQDRTQMIERLKGRWIDLSNC